MTQNSNPQACCAEDCPCNPCMCDPCTCAETRASAKSCGCGPTCSCASIQASAKTSGASCCGGQATA